MCVSSVGSCTASTNQPVRQSTAADISAKAAQQPFYDPAKQAKITMPYGQVSFATVVGLIGIGTQ